MSTQKEDLKALFAQKKGKKNQKKKPEKKKEAEEAKEETKEETVKPEKKVENDAASDSDEENREIKLEPSSNIISMQEVKDGDEEEKKDAGLGWAKLEQNAKQSDDQPKPKAQKQSGPPTFGRSSKGPPMFSSSKNKGIGLAQEEFPELGEAQNSARKGGGHEASNSSKADSANIGQFGAMAQQRDGAQEPKKAGTKPVFSGKAKLKTGQNEELEVNSRQNYDYSSMKMASATAKSQQQKEGQSQVQMRDGQPSNHRGRGGRFQKGGTVSKEQDSDDDGFEMVTNKKRVNKRKDDSDDSDEQDRGGFGGNFRQGRGSRGGFSR